MEEDSNHHLHEKIPMPEEEEEEEEEIVNEYEVQLIDSELDMKTPEPKIVKVTPRPNIKKDERLDKLELLAKQMKEEKDALEDEQKRILEEKMELIKMKE